MSLTLSLSTVKRQARRVVYQVQRKNIFDKWCVVDTFRSYIDAFTYANMLAGNEGYWAGDQQGSTCEPGWGWHYAPLHIVEVEA